MDMTIATAAILLGAGATGGLVRDVMKTGGLVLPHTEQMPDGACILRLGFILAILIGAVTGLVVDHHWLTALVSGYAGPDAIEAAFNLRASQMRRNGRVASGGAP